jgi:hypothetical protein
MEEFLAGLLRDLKRRCTVLCDRLLALDAEDELRSHTLRAFREVEQARRDVVKLLADPSLGRPELLRTQIDQYKQLSEQVGLVESFPLPFLERYAETDRRATRLCHELAQAIRWPLPLPLVGTFSNNYYWTVAAFDVICVPSAELTTLLGIPDLCHELGHVLLLHHEATLVGDFRREVAQYVDAEQRRVNTLQRAPEYHALYDLLFAQWSDAWLREFAADMVATYLVGPAYGWQHIRLCTGQSKGAYAPALGELKEHPADVARLHGVLTVLRSMGAAAVAARIQALWENYLAAALEHRPAEFDLCYPDALIESLTRRVVAGCRTLRLRGFDDRDGTLEDLPALLQEAWRRFMDEPTTYINWETETLARLWRSLGLGS